MLTRSATARRPVAPLALAGRAADARRLRRRLAADARLYCATNGCTTTLQLDPATGRATCPICGYHRRIA